MESNFNVEEKVWDIIDTYFEQDNILVKHHINTYNHFITNLLPNIINDETYSVSIYKDWDKENQIYYKKYSVNFDKVFISKPVIYENGVSKPMYPYEARMRNLSYDATVFVNINHKLEIIDPKTKEVEVINYPTIEKMEICKIPIMLKSKLCVLSEQSNYSCTKYKEGEYDYGGYFIVKGGEKVLIPQERKLENKIYCFKLTSTNDKLSEMAEVTSIDYKNPTNIINTYVKLTIGEELVDKRILVTLRGIKVDIPVFIIFRALNVISDKKIVQIITNNINKNERIVELLEGSIVEANDIQSQSVALEYLSKYFPIVRTQEGQNSKFKLRYTYEKLLENLFPHLGNSNIKKAYYLGLMVKTMLETHLKKREHDDRDSFLNKKIETAGELMRQLFHAHFNKYVKTMKSSLERDIRDGKIEDCHLVLNKKFKPNEITESIRTAFGTGSWGERGQTGKMKGVCQTMSRMTYLSFISVLRRLVAGTIDKSGKQLEPRKLHSSQFGMICPFETPEGGSVGIVKNLSIMCNFTVDESCDLIKSILDENGVESLENIEPEYVDYSIKVFVNGDWYGQTDKPEIIVKKLKKIESYRNY